MVSAYNTLAEDIGAADIPYDFKYYLYSRKNNAMVEGKVEVGYAFCEAVALAVIYLSHVVGNTVVDDKGTAIALYNGAALTMNEGSLSMVASLAALAISVAALGVAIASGKKKGAAKSSDEA